MTVEQEESLTARTATGEGTGLGLSLAYYIIKVHVGEIKVESNEGERSEFIILLPDNL